MIGHTQQRCDCELDRTEAAQGDLPGVCVRCGEATNRFCAAPLYHRMRRVPLRLPLCSADKNHWRRRDWAFYAALSGLGMFVFGLLLFVLTDAIVLEDRIDRLLPVGVVEVFFVVSSGSYLLGLATIAVSLAAYIVLTIRSIQIRRLGRESVTLKRIAPEFAEAYRIHCREKLAQDG